MENKEKRAPSHLHTFDPYLQLRTYLVFEMARN